MSEAVSTKVRVIPPEVEIPHFGLGTMRPSGTYVVLLMQLESEFDRVKILVEAAKDLGITLEQLTDEYLDEACPKCGTSLLFHRDEPEGRCP